MLIKGKYYYAVLYISSQISINALFIRLCGFYWYLSKCTILYNKYCFLYQISNHLPLNLPKTVGYYVYLYVSRETYVNDSVLFSGLVIDQQLGKIVKIVLMLFKILGITLISIILSIRC